MASFVQVQRETSDFVPVVTKQQSQKTEHTAKIVDCSPLEDAIIKVARSTLSSGSIETTSGQPSRFAKLLSLPDDVLHVVYDTSPLFINYKQGDKIVKKEICYPQKHLQSQGWSRVSRTKKKNLILPEGVREKVEDIFKNGQKTSAELAAAIIKQSFGGLYSQISIQESSIRNIFSSLKNREKQGIAAKQKGVKEKGAKEKMKNKTRKPVHSALAEMDIDDDNSNRDDASDVNSCCNDENN
jgi:hypothetical protein